MRAQPMSRDPALLRMPLAASALASGRLLQLSDHVIHNPANHWIVTRVEEDRPTLLRMVERMSSESG